jgi:hypothetical protein
VTVHVGATFRCPPAVADRMGLRPGERVAHLSADRQTELWLFATEMGLDDRRRLSPDTPRERYVITDFERNQALTRGAEPAAVPVGAH